MKGEDAAMDNLVVTLNVVLPVFLVMVAGYLCKSLKIVADSTVNGMNKLVFQVFLPCSLAKSLMSVDRNMPMEYSVLLFCMAGVLATFLAGMLIVPRLVKENPRRGVLIQGMFRSNYAIFGIPLAQALFPQGDGGVAAMMVMATIPLFNVLAVVTLEYFRGGKCSFGKVLLGIVKNPLIWGCLIGFAVMQLAIDLPQFAILTVEKLAAIASPLALFVLGASIDLKKIGGNLRTLLWGTAARLVFVPAVLLPIAYGLGFRGPEFAALMIAYASPCAVSSYTMAAQMDGDGDLAAQMVMLTTVASAFTIFLMVFLFKSLNIF